MAFAELPALAREKPAESEIYKSKWQLVDEEQWKSQEAIRQVEYYFSDENLLKDDHLYDKMHGPMNRPVSLEFIHSFNKMTFFPYTQVVESLKKSKALNLIKSHDKYFVTRCKPYYRPDDAPEGCLLDIDVEVEKKIFGRDILQPLRPPLNDQFKKKLEDASFRKVLQDFSLESGPPKGDRAVQAAAAAGRGHVVGTAGQMRLIRTPGRPFQRGE